MTTTYKIEPNTNVCPELDSLRICYVMHQLALKIAETQISTTEERHMLDRAEALLVTAIQAESRLLSKYPEFASQLAFYYNLWRDQVRPKAA